MARSTLESRVADLESQVEKLTKQLRGANGRRPRKWQDAVEKYAGDPDLQTIFADALKLREADRRRVKNAPQPTSRRKRR
jgi:DNA repair exonuclease SbcCD ATPase subunit